MATTRLQLAILRSNRPIISSIQQRCSSSTYATAAHQALFCNNKNHLIYIDIERPLQKVRKISNNNNNNNVDIMASSSSSPLVHGLFHKDTSTMTYIISDPSSKDAIILDSVLDYEPNSGRTSNTHGEAVVEYCTANSLNVKYILESHVHGKYIILQCVCFLFIFLVNSCI